MTNAERAEKRKALLDQKQSVTGRVSETTRYVGFGLLAIYYALRTSETGFAHELDVAHPYQTALVGLSGLAAILLDYLQYFFGSRSVAGALKRETLDYDTESIWYKARIATFVLKQWAAVFGALLLVTMFVFN